MNDEKEKLKIGEISYANCTPIYATLKKVADCSGYEFVKGVPSALNALLAAGEVDVSSSSSIEYARHAGEYLIIPGVSISSMGEVKSILLFSRKQVEGLGGAKVAVSDASATSTVLLKVLLAERYGVRAEFVPQRPRLSAMLEGSDAALLIGDEALKEKIALSPDSGLYVYDLGSMWREFAGLPFVFALWMIRRDSASRLPELAARLKNDLVKARAGAARDYRALAESAPERQWMGIDGLVDYWGTMSYGLGGAHIEGIEKFFGLAAKAGEIDAVPELGFL